MSCPRTARAVPERAAAAARRSRVTPPEQRSEDVAEVAKIDVVRRVGERAAVAARRVRAPGRRLLRVDGAEAVVHRALLFVAQDFIRLVDFFEAGFRVGVIRVGVRVILLRQLAECLLDFFFIRAAAHAQRFIVVFSHRVSVRLRKSITSLSIWYDEPDNESTACQHFLRRFYSRNTRPLRSAIPLAPPRLRRGYFRRPDARRRGVCRRCAP